MATPLCPNCDTQTIRRIYGIWCCRCRGWYISHTRNGEFRPYIGTVNYLP